MDQSKMDHSWLAQINKKKKRSITVMFGIETHSSHLWSRKKTISLTTIWGKGRKEESESWSYGRSLLDAVAAEAVLQMIASIFYLSIKRERGTEKEGGRSNVFIALITSSHSLVQSIKSCEPRTEKLNETLLFPDLILPFWRNTIDGIEVKENDDTRM